MTLQNLKARMVLRLAYWGLGVTFISTFGVGEGVTNEVRNFFELMSNFFLELYI